VYPERTRRLQMTLETYDNIYTKNRRLPVTIETNYNILRAVDLT